MLKDKVVLMWNESATTDTNLMSTRYIPEVWQPYAETVRGERPRLAVINDNHASHVHPDTLQAAADAKLRFTFLPASVLQPLDVGINKLFKLIIANSCVRSSVASRVRAYMTWVTRKYNMTRLLKSNMTFYANYFDIHLTNYTYFNY